MPKARLRSLIFKTIIGDMGIYIFGWALKNEFKGQGRFGSVFSI